MSEKSTAGTLRAGAAAVEITPVELAGLNPMGADFLGVHDALHARALVLDDGATSAALVSLELLEIGVTTELRRRIEAELGIAADHVVLAPTHTHNAPRAGVTPPGGLSRAASPESLAYTETVFEAIVEVVRRAQAALQPARIGAGEGSVDVNVNRDVLLDGTWVLGVNHDRISDKTLRVLRIDALAGDPIAVVLNYAVHPTVTLGTRQLGADLAGVASRYVEARMPGTVALWTAGTIGDQVPRISYETLGGRDGRATAEETFRAADAQGVLIGAETVRVAEEIVDFATAPAISAAEAVRHYPIKRGTDLPPDMKQDDIAEVGIRLTALRVGDIVLAGVGGEVTTPIGRRLRARSPYAATWVVSIANERIGYLADDCAFSLGTFAARGTPIQPGHVEQGIVDGVVDLLGGLT